MRRTSLRTLVLMLELFVAVASFQYLAAVKPARVDAVWLGGDSDPIAPAAPCEVNDCTLDN